MTLPLEEVKHDANRVEYIRTLVADNEILSVREAHEVSTTLEGIASKHLIKDLDFSLENFVGYGTYAIGICDKMISHFIQLRKG